MQQLLDPVPADPGRAQFQELQDHPATEHLAAMMDELQKSFAAVARFYAKIEFADSGCWLWRGAVTKNSGYGQFSVCFSRPRHVVHNGAHRLAFLLWKGPIPEGLAIDHLCRVRNCVNPEHLEAVTPRENTLRGNTPAAANAHKTHCKRGHPLTTNNLDPWFLRRRLRACIECKRIRGRISDRKRRPRRVANCD